MFLLNELLTFEYQNEYASEYDLTMKKDFRTPKIYTGGGDLSKRWYIYFSFKNPKTGKFERQSPIYAKANRKKTKEERMQILSIYRKVLLRLLNEGFNPYADNNELLSKRKSIAIESKNNLKSSVSIETPLNKAENKGVPEVKSIAIDSKMEVYNSESDEVIAMTIKNAFAFALKFKKKTVSERTYKDYQSKSTHFQNWLSKNFSKVKRVDQLSKNVFQKYLNQILEKTSAKNRNNYRVDLSSLMQVLLDNEIVAMNFVKAISVLKTKPKRNKTYSDKKQEAIFNYLEEKDPLLLLYIKFISYNFLRPIEVNRLTIGDINLEEQTLAIKTKTNTLKTKIIPDILVEELKLLQLSQYKTSNYLFTPKGIGLKWKSKEDNRRDYFSKRFKKVVKLHFDLSANYGLYSFRHTFITKLYRELRKSMTPFEAKSELMLITGHSTMVSPEKYLRDIDAELPEDYSVHLKKM